MTTKTQPGGHQSRLAQLSALLTRYPYQFREIQDANIRIGPGWFELVAGLCAEIDSELDDLEKQRFWWVQLKEKFGGLRAYWSAGAIRTDIMLVEGGVACITPPPATPFAAKVEARIDKFERASKQICERCGTRDGVQLDHCTGWLRSLCPRCSDRRLVISNAACVMQGLDMDHVEHWYASEPIEALGGKTADVLVEEGRAVELVEYLRKMRGQ